MVERKVTVVNPTGLHLRPAGLLCQTSMKFDSKVMIFYKEKEINAKSVLNVMASGIRCGDEITVHCDGPDEKEAIEAVCNLIETGLKEEDPESSTGRSGYALYIKCKSECKPE